MYWPKQLVIRRAKVDLPLPGRCKGKTGPRVDGRPEVGEEVRIDGNIRKGLLQAVAAGGLGPDRLGIHRDDVIGQRHGRRSHVRAVVEQRLGPLPALLRQTVNVVVQWRRRGVDQDLAGAEGMIHVLQDSEGQPHLLGDAAAAAGTDDREVLANERFNERRRQSRILDRVGQSRQEFFFRLDGCQELFAERGSGRGGHRYPFDAGKGEFSEEL